MKTKHKISIDELHQICAVFHKLTRTSDLTKNADLWKAINELDDYNFSELMDWSLEEIGIKVKREYECYECGKMTVFDTRPSYHPTAKCQGERYRAERERMHEQLCLKCYRKEHDIYNVGSQEA